MTAHPQVVYCLHVKAYPPWANMYTKTDSNIFTNTDCHGIVTTPKHLPPPFPSFHLPSTVAAAWRMFSSVKAFEGQQYSALKKQCLQSGTLFEDPFFPAVDDSLFYQGNRIGRVHWKRPGVSCLHEFLTSTVRTGFAWEKRIPSWITWLRIADFEACCVA